VQRVFGTEVLKISRAACDLSRVPVPLLDSHSQASIDSVVGRVSEVWIDGGKLQSRITFAQTPRGCLAEGMVSRNELSALSCGYQVSEWSAVDADGDPVDPSRADWDDGLVFTAERWTLLEASVVGAPADAGALVRSLGRHFNIADVRARMECRARMVARHGMARDDEF
jgi:phage head maturation protease